MTTPTAKFIMQLIYFIEFRLAIWSVAPKSTPEPMVEGGKNEGYACIQPTEFMSEQLHFR